MRLYRVSNSGVLASLGLLRIFQTTSASLPQPETLTLLLLPFSVLTFLKCFCTPRLLSPYAGRLFPLPKLVPRSPHIFDTGFTRLSRTFQLVRVGARPGPETVVLVVAAAGLVGVGAGGLETG